MNGKIALIEAGGTKFIVGVADALAGIEARTRIDTTTPRETIAAAIKWLQNQQPGYDAVGVASFGPLDLNRSSKQWGHVTRTAKPHWSGADIAGPLGNALDCAVAIDTDVNGAALAEWRWGAGSGTVSSLYLTVGTGVGGGAVVGGRLLHGLGHPEMGHIRMPRHPADLSFKGLCPFHRDCLEGLASGLAIKARWGGSLSELPVDHHGHGIIAWYLAQAAVTFQAMLEPERIILGGGVMGTPGLLNRVRSHAMEVSAGYFVGTPDKIIVAPALGENTGLLGALALTQVEGALQQASGHPQPSVEAGCLASLKKEKGPSIDGSRDST